MKAKLIRWILITPTTCGKVLFHKIGLLRLRFLGIIPLSLALLSRSKVTGKQTLFLMEKRIYFSKTAALGLRVIHIRAD